MGRSVRNRIAGPCPEVRGRVGCLVVNDRLAPLLDLCELLGQSCQPAKPTPVVLDCPNPVHDRALGRGWPAGVRVEEKLVVGSACRRERRDTPRLGSSVPRPTRRGVRCKLKSGIWIGGVFGEVDGRRPYASGYPEPQDLYLAATLHLDPDTGEILTNGEGHPKIQNSGILVRWEEIEYLEFTEAASEEEDS